MLYNMFVGGVVFALVVTAMVKWNYDGGYLPGYRLGYRIGWWISKIIPARVLKRFVQGD
jgi:uncharacterized membrane protein YfcA